MLRILQAGDFLTFGNEIASCPHETCVFRPRMGRCGVLPNQTRATLILRLRDAGDDRSWEEFVEIYTPLLYHFFTGRGLQDADAADLGQEVMRAVARAIGRFEYDPEKGTFRSWLYTIARNKLKDFFKKRARQPQGSGRTTVMRVVETTEANEQDLEEYFELEHRRRLYEWASEKVKGSYAEHNWLAFERVALRQEDAAVVAADLGLSVGAVYVAKSRITTKLRETIESIDGEWPELP